MAKTKGRAGERAVTAGRDGPHGRKSGAPKAAGSGSRKPNSTKLTPRKRKPSPASETARLKRQLKTARMQQEASAEILRAVANASGDAARPLQQIAETTARLFGAPSVSIQLAEGNEFTQEYRVGGIAQRVGSAYPRSNIKVGGRNLPGTVVFENWQIHIPDLDRLDPSMSDFPGLPHARAGGARTVCGTPLRREGKAIGVLIVFRDRLLPFTADELALQQSFTDQAVIAIQNARLFEAEQQRTRELAESLEQQTATADVLRVISSSLGDLQPVFSVMLEKAAQICDASYGNIYRWDGDALHYMASHNTPEALVRVRKGEPLRPEPASPLGIAIATRSTWHTADLSKEPAYVSRLSPSLVAGVELGRIRANLFVPMLKEDELVGMFSLFRHEARAFTDKQIALVQNFAAQAVIAIENARLLNELRERTSDLAEALEQQTATSEVLQVISSSPSDPEPVFAAMLDNAVRICDANFGSIFRWTGGALHLVATRNAPAEYAEARRHLDTTPRPGDPMDRVLTTKNIVHIADLAAEASYVAGHNPQVSLPVEQGGVRTVLFVPMLLEDEPIGVFSLFRREVRPFTDKEIGLVANFAAQAVIAIENARLLDELRQSLKQQTATADVLKVISRSTFDLRTVLDTLVEFARTLCDAPQGMILLRDGQVMRMARQKGSPAAFERYLLDNPLQVGPYSGAGRAAFTGEVAHFPDVLDDPHYRLGEGQRLGGYRALLSVPLLREQEVVGVFCLGRPTPGPFTSCQVELVRTFADQAVIAIENVRLFESVEARTRDLATSLRDLRTAQDRLVQTEKLASLGQLTAGIAHEIKNPLNFVNNFSAVSAELVDELREALGSAHLDSKLRAEIGEITGMLHGNLNKVVQHGKRADAIVKNMLLHSRQGSGEHRLVDINALVDESLNLAYHGARAEKQGFNVTLEKSFDPAAGEVDLFPQEITRVLLNLISNGFYAATKRKTETNGGDYEPTLAAATKNLGDSVEIRIRDNGTGIPPEVKEKMFNPFFTTKPAGEGTGLGLSISYDIVVKQHAGSIEVDTQLGEFTEIRIILPRSTGHLSGERA